MARRKKVGKKISRVEIGRIAVIGVGAAAGIVGAGVLETQVKKQDFFTKITNQDMATKGLHATQVVAGGLLILMATKQKDATVKDGLAAMGAGMAGAGVKNLMVDFKVAPGIINAQRYRILGGIPTPDDAGGRYTLNGGVPVPDPAGGRNTLGNMKVVV